MYVSHLTSIVRIFLSDVASITLCIPNHFRHITLTATLSIFAGFLYSNHHKIFYLWILNDEKSYLCEAFSTFSSSNLLTICCTTICWLRVPSRLLRTATSSSSCFFGRPRTKNCSVKKNENHRKEVSKLK